MTFESFSISRRKFIVGTAATLTAGVAIGTGAGLFAQDLEPERCAPPASGKPPEPFTPNMKLDVGVRKSASMLSESEVARLRKAYQALRDLRTKDPSDPRGWLQQGNVHCWNCGGGTKDTDAVEIHGSWLFLPWHRAYLYFHERILATLIQDPTFRLPYWDWDISTRNALPPPYAAPTGNSLFDANRNAQSGDRVPSLVAGPRIMQGVMNAPNFPAFSGDASSGGVIEGTPHGGVHIWVGDKSLQSAKIDMGVLSTAAQDPLFFAHHGNIDRLWRVWEKSSPDHKNPTDDGWLKTKFNFYDENKQWTSIAIADVLKMDQSLRYTYEAQAGLVETSTATLTSKLEVASGGVVRLPGRLSEAAKSAGAIGGSGFSLLLEGVDQKPLQVGITGIFDGVGDGGKLTPESSNYLGYVAIVPANTARKAHRHGAGRVAVDLTLQLKRLAGRNEVRLVAVPLSAPVESRRAEPLQLSGASLVEVRQG